MFFAKGKTKEKIVIFDFRSSSVAAAIAIIDPETELPKISFCKRENYYFQTPPQPEEFINRAHIALKRLINDINSTPIKEKGVSNEITSVFILYGSPWYTPNFVDVQYEQDKHFIFSHKLSSKIAQGTDNPDFADQHSQIIEKNIVSVLINGYETPNPFDKKTNEVKLSFYFSKIAKETKNDIEKIIRDNMHVREIHHHTHPNVLHSFLKHNFHSTNNYLMLDVSGEITEITIVKNSFFKRHVTIPVGSHVFSRKLSEICNYDVHTAWTHLNLYIDKKIDPQCKVNAEVVFEEIKTHWINLIKKSFHQEKIVDIPSTIFIVSDNESRNLVKHIFETPEGYAGALKIPRKPHIISFGKEAFSNMAIYDKKVCTDNIISIFANFVKIYRR